MLTKVNEILKLLLEIEFDENSDLKRSEVSEWDSLKHIELVMLLEEEFNIRLKDSDLSNLTSTKQIVETISKYVD